MTASTPEAFARRIDELAVRAADFDGGTIGATYDLAALIHDRDEQIRADERARVSVVHSTLTDERLAGLCDCGTCEANRRDRQLREGATFTVEQLVAELVRRGVLEERGVRYDMSQEPVRREVRYGSDWLVDTRTPEQRSDDAIATLRHRLAEEPTDG